MTTPDRISVRAQRRQLQRWVDFSPSSFLQSRFSIPDFHLFGAVKDAHRGRRFAEDDEMKRNVRWRTDASAKIFTWPSCSVSGKLGKRVLIMKETLWKNNFKFQYNCNYSFWGKKKRKHYFLTGPRKIVCPSCSTLQYLCSWSIVFKQSR
jgi:hypothetical protein